MSTIPSNPTAIHPVTVQISMEVGITLFLWDFFCDFDVSVMLTMERGEKDYRGKALSFHVIHICFELFLFRGEEHIPTWKKKSDLHEAAFI